MKILRIVVLVCISLFFASNVYSQEVRITVFAKDTLHEVSPFLYGRNNSFSKQAGDPTPASQIQLYKEAGLRFARENNGNNSTKYNWRKKLSSYPDWYNNVYSQSWDYASEVIASEMPSLSVMWGFQLIGKAASSNEHNFDEWEYNRAQWWSGVRQNLAGGGEVNPEGGSEALVEGDTALYLTHWPADSTTAILDHWFGEDGIGLEKEQFRYWSMDNEPDIWSGTHDDVMEEQIAADAFMEKYFSVAKLARAKFPGIKLTGPVTANEWQWFNWGNESLRIDGEYYSWLEYFLKRVAEEEKASGLKLLDMVDIHFYPTETSDTEVLQLHRVFYDHQYVYPGANGLHTLNGGWDTSLNKEYIFQRIEDWLDEHFGENHGIEIGLTEFGTQTDKPNINSVLYASMLGTFANHGVEVFSPWDWKSGMWEVLHLFSRYAKDLSVQTSSSQDSTVSGYSTITTSGDSVTIMLVNRDLTATKETTIYFPGLSVPDGEYELLELSSLPSTETFQSRTENALKRSTVTISENTANLSLPPLSVSALLLSGEVETSISEEEHSIVSYELHQNYPNPFNPSTVISYQLPVSGEVTLQVFDITGREITTLVDGVKQAGNHRVTFNAANLSSGIYFFQLTTSSGYREIKKMTLLK